MSRLPSYRPSGRISPRYVPMAAIALGLVIVAAWPYQKLITWIPFIYLNAVVYGVFLAVVWGASTLAARYGNNRNRLVAAVVGATIGLAAVGASHYVAYHALIDQVVTAGAESDGVSEASIRPVIEDAVTFGMYVDARLETGWSLGHGSSGGIPLHGAFVWLFWGLEALGLVAAGLYGGWSQPPFCEACQAWMPASTLAVQPNVAPEVIDRVATAGSLDELVARPARGTLDLGPPLQVAYTLHACEACTGGVFVSVAKQWDELGKRGPETRRQPLHDRLAMSRADVELLRARLAEPPVVAPEPWAR
ncbi:MAG: hypothetical protein R3B06_00970 [Kofleriaceae bacterium]